MKLTRSVMAYTCQLYVLWNFIILIFKR